MPPLPGHNSLRRPASLWPKSYFEVTQQWEPIASLLAGEFRVPDLGYLDAQLGEWAAEVKKLHIGGEGRPGLGSNRRRR